MNQMMKTYFKSQVEEPLQQTEKVSNSALQTRWPGVQLYYPPIKYLPQKKAYESIDVAIKRFEKPGLNTRAHTLLFDLEDGCMKKTESRELLRSLAPRFHERKFQIAIRINSFLSEEYRDDLLLLNDIGTEIDVVMLAKAGERYGLAEIRDLSADLLKINTDLKIQPIIEHPRSLKIASQLMDFKTVNDVVFGIHDFSKSMGIRISAIDWLNELKSWLHLLLLEARLHGTGVIGGVDTLINQTCLPSNLLEKEDVEKWVNTSADFETGIVYSHACRESSMGLTGKQVFHPNHIDICRAAFHPSPSEIQRARNILDIAIEASAFRGGAIRYEDEMLDPPMFGKAIQTMLRSNALNVLSEEDKKYLADVLELAPRNMVKEIWPFS